MTNDHLDSYLECNRAWQVCEIEKTNGIATNGLLFSMFTMLEDYFFQTHGVARFGGMKLFLHLFVFSKQIIIIVTFINKQCFSTTLDLCTLFTFHLSQHCTHNSLIWKVHFFALVYLK